MLELAEVKALGKQRALTLRPQRRHAEHTNLENMLRMDSLELLEDQVPVVDDPISDDYLQQPTRISMFDICRRGGELNKCGVYMEPNWWWQNPNGAWDFRCALNPSKIRATDPAAYGLMKLEMAGIPETDWSNRKTKADHGGRGAAKNKEWQDYEAFAS